MTIVTRSTERATKFERDGYRAVQVTVGAQTKADRLTKAEAGHFAAAKVDAGDGLYEFRLEQGEVVWAKRQERDELLEALENWQGGLGPEGQEDW